MRWKKRAVIYLNFSQNSTRVFMQNPSTQSQSQSAIGPDLEDILVVPRNQLFTHVPAWHGINADAQPFITQIKTFAQCMPRVHAETNPDFKQIIPYLIFLFDQKLFVMQRKSSASEQRLANKFSIGIGGHIRQEDIQHNDILGWADREFAEEVTYHGNKTMQVVGILNDDSDDVGKVHLGIVIVVQADSNKISINDEHKSGILMSRAECLQVQSSMENWSKICLNFLIQQNLF
jgi:predicted NUDIX family phosphoesterase